jgi:hypothetical protein
MYVCAHTHIQTKQTHTHTHTHILKRPGGSLKISNYCAGGYNNGRVEVVVWGHHLFRSNVLRGQVYAGEGHFLSRAPSSGTAGRGYAARVRI